MFFKVAGITEGANIYLSLYLLEMSCREQILDVSLLVSKMLKIAQLMYHKSSIQVTKSILTNEPIVAWAKISVLLLQPIE